MPDQSRGRTPYRSSEAVLAEAQRIASDIRRRAEREANAIRREAAEWASATRQEADRYRQSVLAQLEHARALAEPDVDVDAGAEDEIDAERDPPPAATPVIDLRTPTDVRPVRLVIVPRDEEGPPGDHDEPAAQAETDVETGEDVAEAQHRPAVGGTYVVGHRLPAPGTSIETKVHDVVRLAVRRTFNRRFP